MCLRAYGFEHVVPCLWLRAYGSGRTREPVRVHRLGARDVHVGDPNVPKPGSAQHLLNREMHRCVLRIAMRYENGACEALGGKLAMKRVHVQRLVSRGLFLKQASALKPCCG